MPFLLFSSSSAAWSLPAGAVNNFGDASLRRLATTIAAAPRRGRLMPANNYCQGGDWSVDPAKVAAAKAAPKIPIGLETHVLDPREVERAHQRAEESGRVKPHSVRDYLDRQRRKVTEGLRADRFIEHECFVSWIRRPFLRCLLQVWCA